MTMNTEQVVKLLAQRDEEGYWKIPECCVLNNDPGEELLHAVIETDPGVVEIYYDVTEFELNSETETVIFVGHDFPEDHPIIDNANKKLRVLLFLQTEDTWIADIAPYEDSGYWVNIEFKPASS